MKQKVIWIIAIILTILFLVMVCYEIYKKNTQIIQNPIVTMEIEGYGTVKMELYPDMEPNTVEHFINVLLRDDGWQRRGMYIQRCAV